MKYFLVYLYKGLVVDICSFDNEAAQLASFYADSNKPDYLQHLRYDSVQPFNQIC